MGGNTKGTRRRFGAVRRISSGRWQARVLTSDGVGKRAPHTFTRKGDAERWLIAVEAELLRGDWIDPAAGQTSFGAYADSWVRERDLSETTRDRYDGLLRNYLLPSFGRAAVNDIRDADVRQWRHTALSRRAGQPTVAKAYRLLRAILYTAVDDGLIRRNPCRIKGAGEDAHVERSLLTLAEVFDVASALTERYRTLVVLATFTSLRFGELAALRRSDMDVATGVVHVRQSQAELRGGRVVVKGPKSAAGRRTVAIPEAILAGVQRHLDQFAEPGPQGRVFIGPKGGHLRRRNFHRLWTAALVSAGLGDRGLHFHDLRHTGNHLAAATGASTRELMARMGHSSVRAALIYQHATSDRDRAIAASVSGTITTHLAQVATSTSGTNLAGGSATGHNIARHDAQD